MVDGFLLNKRVPITKLIKRLSLNTKTSVSEVASFHDPMANFQDVGGGEYIADQFWYKPDERVVVDLCGREVYNNDATLRAKDSE